MAYRDFENDFKRGTTRDVMVFSGAEDYLMEWAAEQVIGRYVDEAWRSLDVRYLEGDIVSAYDILAEARAYSMFSEKRVVIVRNFLPLYRKSSETGYDDLLSAAGESQGGSVLIFILESRFSGDITSFGKKLVKACRGYDFARLERADLKTFINKRIHEGGKILGRREMDYLIDLSGYYNRESEYDLTRLEGDISKLVKAADADGISADLIEEILIGDSDRFVFDLVDAVVKGDRIRALEVAETIIREGDGAMAATALITKQFEIMYDSLELSARGSSISQMIKMTGVNEFRFRKAYKAAGAYSPARIKKLLTDLYNIDRDIKKGVIDRDVALELFAVSAGPAR